MSNFSSKESQFLKTSIHDLFKEDIKSSLRKKSQSITLLIIGIGICLVSFIFKEDNAFYVFLGLGVVLTIIGIVILATIPALGKITKLAKIHMPVSIHSDVQGKSYVLDRSLMNGECRLQFKNMEQSSIKELNNLFDNFEQQIKQIPIALSEDRSGDSSLHEEENLLVENIQSVNKLMDNVNEKEINLPAIPGNQSILELLKISSDDLNGGVKIESIDEEEINSLISEFEGKVNVGKESVDVDDLSKSYSDSIRQNIGKYDNRLDQSINDELEQAMGMYDLRVSELCNDNYCPSCNAEYTEYYLNKDYNFKDEINQRPTPIENTRLTLIDPLTRTWECPACRSKTNYPIVINKLDNDVFSPTYDALFEEHFKDRLKIYNHIVDEKRKYAEKAASEFHTVLRENRSKVDDVKSKLRSINAEVQSDSEAIEHLKSIMMKYDQISQERSVAINHEINQIKIQVAENTRKAKEEIDESLNAIKQEIEEKSEQYAQLEAEDQKKRDEVQEQIAKNTYDLAELERNYQRHIGAIEEKPWWKKAAEAVMGKDDSNNPMGEGEQSTGSKQPKPSTSFPGGKNI